MAPMGMDTFAWESALMGLLFTRELKEGRVRDQSFAQFEKY